MKNLLKSFAASAGMALSAVVASADALPEGYVELEYVESDGTQRLDTRVCPTAQTRVVCDCLFTSDNNPQRCGMVKDDNALFVWGRESNYAGRYGSIVSTDWNMREDSGVAWDRGRHVFDLASGSQKLDGAEYGTHTMTATSTASLWLFCTYYDSKDWGVSWQYPCHMRLFSCQIYEGTELVRDYVPARNEKGEVGLYDRKQNIFVPPDQGTLFAKRRNVLPEGYVALASATSTGNQCVDTGIKASAKTRVVCDCQFTNVSYPQRNGSSVTDSVFLWGMESAYNHFGSIVSTTWNNREDSKRSGDLLRHEFDLCPGSQKLDGAQYGQHAFSTTSSRSLWLFGANEADDKVSYPCQMKLFACRIYEDGALVRDYVPVRDPLGQVGLYDLENGDFVAPAIGILRTDEALSLPEGYTAVEYVESDGTQYLDTGCKASNQRRVVCDLQFTKTGIAQRNGYDGNGSAVFLWGLESAYDCNFGSIVNADWNARGDTKVSGDTARHTFDLRLGAQWFDSKRYATHSYTENGGKNMWLFGGNLGDQLRYACSERIYACQFFEGETLVRNYVPAVDETGEAGLYDLVNKTFAKSSFGSLVAAGSDVLPAGYTALAYVESDGSQYLDTGVFPGPRTRVISDCNFVSLPAYTSQRCGSSYGENTFLWGIDAGLAGRFGSIVNSTAWGSREDTGIAGSLEQHRFDLQSGSQKFNGTEYGTGVVDNNVGLSIWLFGSNEGSGGVSYKCSMRLYRFQAFDGEMRIRDYVPAQDPSGTVGLYDRVSGQFVAPVGTLAAGPAVEPTMSPDSLTVTANPLHFGTPAPGYGSRQGLHPGDAFACTVDGVATNVTGMLVATCTGCVVTVDGVVTQTKTFEPGETPRVDYVHPTCTRGATLKWLWRVSRLLPSGMTLIEYAEFPSGAFVETGIALEDQELRLSYESTTYVSGASVVGQNQDNLHLHWSEEDGVYSWGLSGEVVTSRGQATCSPGRHEVVIDRTGDHAIVFDGVVLGTGKPVTSSMRNIRIGRRVRDPIFEGRVYGLDVLDHATGALALSLKPAMDRTGTVGLYDVVSGRFLVSEGTPLRYVDAPFAIIGNEPSSLDRYSVFSSQGTVALSSGETFTVTAKRQRVYDRTTSTPYVLAGWTLVAEDAEGSREVRVSGPDEIGACSFVPEAGKRYSLKWNWTVGEPSGSMLIVR